MNDPFNTDGPIDPEWEALAERLAEDAARQLGGMVLFVVMQPAGGKTGITIKGEPLAGPLAEMAKDIPAFFAMMAVLTKAKEEFDKAHGKRDKSH
jgi:hypothetical protein